MKHLALHAGEREHRNEGKNDDDHGKGDRPAYKPRGLQRDLPDVIAIVAVLRFVLLRLSNHVFCHHNARVYQHADGDGDSSQRHDVRRDARALHEQKSAQHRKGQGNGNHQDAAEVPQKKHVRERDQDQLFNQCAAQCVYRVIDENAAVIERNDPYAGWQAWLNLADLLLDGLDDIARIGAVANDNHPAHSFFSIFVENTAAELGTKLHAAHIAHGYGYAVESAKRYILNVLQAVDQSDAAYHFLGVTGLNHLRAHVVVASLHRGDHILERDVVSTQLDGIEIDLVLLQESAYACNFGHARHGVQLVLHEPVLDGAERAAVVGTLDRVPVDLAHSGCVRSHHWRYAGR